MPDELLIPFLTVHTIREMLELVILKCFGTGPNLEKAFGQDMRNPFGGFRERHSSNLLRVVLGRQ